jgi:hypothetical protein
MNALRPAAEVTAMIAHEPDDPGGATRRAFAAWWGGLLLINPGRRASRVMLTQNANARRSERAGSRTR